MTFHFKKTLLVAVCLVFFAVAANAQEHREEKKGHRSVPVIIVRSAAKVTWVATKVVAKNVVKPVLFKAVPKATILLLRGTGLGAKALLPYAAKLAVL
ncbi:MAG: hypothetical protein HS105_06830 [Chloracidobacterium sp.]|nr:hypothetical protein [Chloracidobacterium sp.]MCC6826006.1 hypothetical protein [Acidobacteriota bacterium]MCO5334892.1 hypothetical protein [Pyrinomonadaceae bacterium]